MVKIQWSYMLEDQWQKLESSDNRKIEHEYIDLLNGHYMGGLVFHCFGDRGTACVDFAKMQTYCASWKCEYYAKQEGRDHTNHKT